MNERAASSSFFVEGGTVPLDALCYVTRQADTELLETLLAGKYAYLLNARQMGKSSLCTRVRDRLEQRGVRTVFLDMQRFGGANAVAEQWYASLTAAAGQDLGRRAEFLNFFKTRREFPPVQRFFDALREVALERGEEPIVVFVDEIDAVRSLPFSADEFFGGIRACFNRRADDPAMHRLTFCLIGAASPADLVADKRISPFNIGRQIALSDFTETEAVPLAAGLGPGGAALLSRALYWTGGHPYLTQRLCLAAAEAHASGPADIDRICKEMFFARPARARETNLSFVGSRLLKDPEYTVESVLDLYGKVWAGGRVIDEDTNPLCAVLRLSGIAVADPSGRLRVRNRIYARAFDRAWIQENLPDAEKRRQRRAASRARWQVGSIAACVLAVMGTLTWLARENARHADEARRVADRALQNVYATSLDQIGRTLTDPKIPYIARWQRIETVLEQFKENPARGPEWDFWKRQSPLSARRHAHDKPLTALALSPDGRTLVSLASDEKRVRLWDSKTLKMLGDLSLDRPGVRILERLAFSPDGRTLAVSGIAPAVFLFDLRDLTRPPRTFQVPGMTNVVALSFHPDAPGHLAVLWEKGPVREGAVWDLARGMRLYGLPDCSSLAFSPDGEWLACSRWPDPQGRSQVDLLETKRGKATVSLGDPAWPKMTFLWTVAFSPDGKLLAVGSGRPGPTGTVTGETTAFSTEGRQVVHRFGGRNNGVISLSFAPGNRGRLLAGGWDEYVQELNLATGEASMVGLGRVGAYLPDGRHYVVGTVNGDLYRVRPQPPAPSLALLGSAAVHAVAFSADSSKLAVGEEGKVSLYRLDRLEEPLWTRDFGRKVSALCFSRQGDLLAVAGQEKRILRGKGQEWFLGMASVWETATGRSRGAYRRTPLASEKLEGYFDQTRLAFSPDGSTLAVGDARGGVRLFSSAPGMKPLWEQGTPEGMIEVASLRFSPDGSKLTVGYVPNVIGVWDVDSGRLAGSLRSTPVHLTQLALSPRDGGMALGSSVLAYLWDGVSSRPRAELGGHTGDISAMSFSEEGRRLVTTGRVDGTARIWDVGTGQEVLMLDAPPNVSALSAAISPDNSLLAVGYSDGVRLWLFRNRVVPHGPDPIPAVLGPESPGSGQAGREALSDARSRRPAGAVSRSSRLPGRRRT